MPPMMGTDRTVLRRVGVPLSDMPQQREEVPEVVKVSPNTTGGLSRLHSAWNSSNGFT